MRERPRGRVQGEEAQGKRPRGREGRVRKRPRGRGRWLVIGNVDSMIVCEPASFRKNELTGVTWGEGEAQGDGVQGEG